MLLLAIVVSVIVVVTVGWGTGLVLKFLRGWYRIPDRRPFRDGRRDDRRRGGDRFGA